MNHVVHFAGWYPHDEDPYLGAFVRSHIQAISPFVKCSVIHLVVGKAAGISLPTIKIDKTVVHGKMIEYRVTVETPIRRFGMHDKLVRHAFTKAIKKVINDQGPITLYHIHVRNHLTKLVPFLDSLKDTRFFLTEHWSFYHRGIHQLDQESQEACRKEIGEWFSLPNLFQVLPVSTDLASILITRFSAPAQSITVIPNVADAVFQRDRKKAPADLQRIRLVMVARWEAPKNPKLLLDALQLLKPEERMRFHIDFIGEGTLEEEAQRLGKKYEMETVFFHGFQSKAFIADKLNRAHYLVHPTDAENLPAVIIESLCCGTPVLSHRTNGIPELLDERNGIMCAVQDVQEFAAELRGILNGARSFDRDEIAKNAQARFSPTAVGKRIFESYQRAVSFP